MGGASCHSSHATLAVTYTKKRHPGQEQQLPGNPDLRGTVTVRETFDARLVVVD